MTFEDSLQKIRKDVLALRDRCPGGSLEATLQVIDETLISVIGSAVELDEEATARDRVAKRIGEEVDGFVDTVIKEHVRSEEETQQILVDTVRHLLRTIETHTVRGNLVSDSEAHVDVYRIEHQIEAVWLLLPKEE